MRVKLLLLGIASFLNILDKSNASHKCYRAKICIHDGKEKCGQDNMKGEIRRFLDSCDMKEYNCLRDTNFVKTDFKSCRNLPSIDKIPSADDKINDDENEVNVSESKFVDDDDEPNVASNVKKLANGIKEDRAVGGTQEDENDGLDDEGDKKSKKNTSDKTNKVDDIDEVNKDEKNDEESNLEVLTGSKEDRADGVSQKIENEGANEGEDSVQGNTKNDSDEASKVDNVDDVNKEEKSYEEGEENANKPSKEDKANKGSKENETGGKNDNNDYDGADESNKMNEPDEACKEDKEVSADQENEAEEKGEEKTERSQEENITRPLTTRKTIHPGQAAVINEYWCWRTKYCHSTGDVVCGRDRRLNERRKFNSACDLYQHNCDESHDFTVTDIKFCKGY